MKQHKQDSTWALVADNSKGSEGFSMADLMASYEMPGKPKRGSIVTGEVVQAIKSGFLVSLGLKSDSLVRDAAPGELLVGQSYEFYVCDPEGESEEEPELSFQRAKTWSRLAGLTASQEVVTAKVHSDPRRAVSRSNGSDRVGGLIAFVDGIRSFIPRREIPQRCRIDSLVGREIPVTVLSANPAEGRGGAVVLSYNNALDKIRKNRIEELNAGDIIEGKIVAMIEIGFLVDVGGELTGLVPKSEISGDRRGDTANRFQRGDEVTVKVISRNVEAGKISLSIRQARSEAFLQTLSEGQVVTGVVARFEQYGAFVCLNDCIDGLLHNVDLATVGGRREKLVAGATIEVEVVTIDIEKGRVGLSRKAMSK